MTSILKESNLIETYSITNRLRLEETGIWVVMARKMSWSINHGSCRWFSWPFKMEWISFAGQFSARGTCGKETVVSTWTHLILKHQLLQSECIWLTLKNSALWDLIQCKKLFIVHVLKVDAHNTLLDALMSFLFLAAPWGMWDWMSPTRDRTLALHWMWSLNQWPLGKSQLL